MSKELRKLADLTEEESIEYSVCAWARALQITNGAMDKAIPLQTFHGILPRFGPPRTSRGPPGFSINLLKNLISKKNYFTIQCDAKKKDTIHCSRDKKTSPYFGDIETEYDDLKTWVVPNNITVTVTKGYDFHIDKYNLLSFFILMYLHKMTESTTIDLNVSGLDKNEIPALEAALKMRCIWAGMKEDSVPNVTS